jgi:hypothetical protein
MSSRQDPEEMKLRIEMAEPFEKEVKLRKNLLLYDIQQNGIFAPMDPEHYHRIRMKRLDLEEAKINLGTVMKEKGFDDWLDNFEEQLRNYRSWERRMRTVWSDKSPWFIRKQLEFVNSKIEKYEGRIQDIMEIRG